VLAGLTRSAVRDSLEGVAAMAEDTEFTMEARASCSDGFVGEVIRVIIDPRSNTITHLVIEPKHRHERGRLVPFDLVTSMPGDDITLRCTLAEFDRLDHAEETENIPDLMNVTGMPTMGVHGMGVAADPRHHETAVQDNIPMGEAEVGHGDPVYAVDGEIGRVHGFLVSPGDHQVTHVLLEEGHLWGRKEVAIPMNAIKGFDAGIRLNITRKQVEGLPAVD
jgi:uncharacterized protein YrrD